MPRIRVFRYLADVDAFEVTPEYREVAEKLGLAEWNAVVWIGRLFTLDNDFGEHWFDNWSELDLRSEAAGRAGRRTEGLLVVDPSRFTDGKDGPCNSPEIRRLFWRDVLIGLELGTEVLCAKARDVNERRRAAADSDDPVIDDLEDRIAELFGVAGQ